MQPSEIIYALRSHMSLPVVLTRGKKKFVAQKHRISYICGQRELAAEKKMHRIKKCRVLGNICGSSAILSMRSVCGRGARCSWNRTLLQYP
jgi:hypothetical protein